MKKKIGLLLVVMLFLVSCQPIDISPASKARPKSKVYTTVAYGTILAVSDGKEIVYSTQHEDASNGIFK